MMEVDDPRLKPMTGAITQALKALEISVPARDTMGVITDKEYKELFIEHEKAHADLKKFIEGVTRIDKLNPSDYSNPSYKSQCYAKHLQEGI